MSTTKIEWADETINPLVGCSRISPACDHCYAIGMAHRHGGNAKLPQYHGLTRMTDHGPDWTGEVRWVPGVLENGHKCIPLSECDNFDYSGGGCQGHPCEDSSPAEVPNV